MTKMINDNSFLQKKESLFDVIKKSKPDGFNVCLRQSSFSATYKNLFIGLLGNFDKLTPELYFESEINLYFKSNLFTSSFLLKDFYFENKNSSLSSVLRIFHRDFLQKIKVLYDFVYLKKDAFFLFSKENKDLKTSNSLVLFSQSFKKNILSKLYCFSDFEKIAKPIIQKKIDDYLSIEFKTNKFEETGEMYILKKDFSIDEMIKTNTFPSIVTLKLAGVEMKDNFTFEYFFATGFPSNLSIKHDRNRYLIICKNKYGVVASYSEDVIIFESKIEAESYLKNELLDLQKKIGRLLKSPVRF